MEDSMGAGGKPAGEPRRRGAKAPGGANRRSGKTARVQLHLDELTAKRLGVHCALEGRNQSAEAGRILLQYLSQYGKGRELFGDPPQEVSAVKPSQD